MPELWTLGIERGYVKKSAVIFTPILVIGLAIAFFALSRVDYEKFGILQWIVAISVGFVIVWIIATLLNIALFAPVFWLLGKLHSKKIEKKSQHEHDA